MASETDYSTITNPYSTQLIRQPDSLDVTLGGGSVDQSVSEQQNAALVAMMAQPGGNTAASSTVAGGAAQQATVASGGAMSDVTISSSIQSTNWAPKTVGFYINGQTGYAEFSNIFVKGGITASNLDIPDIITSDSFHVDVLGNTWWGTTPALFTANNSNALAYILKTGVAKFQNVTITGGSVAAGTISGTISATNIDVSANGWTQTCVFSVGSATQVNWASGSFITAAGVTYAISSGNTGTMAAKTYIYLDTGTSTTAYQVTTTAATAVGVGKVLIGVAQNDTNEATFQMFGGNGGMNIDAANIVAGSVTANEIAAGAITAAKINVSQLSAITADMGSLTAGSININSGAASISSAGAAVFKSIQVGGSSVQYTINDSGIFNYGDGSDGTGTITASASLTSDKYYTNLTINNSAVLDPGGYRIFVSGTLTLGGVTAGSIDRSGRNGSNGTTGSTGGAGIGGAGGAAWADGYLKGALAGPDGPTGGTGTQPPGFSVNGAGGGSSTGIGTSNSIGSSSNAGGGSGNGGNGFGSGGGSVSLGAGSSSGATATPSNVKLIANWHLATLLDVTSSGSTIKFDNSASAGAGASGANGGGTNFGAGGTPGGGGGGGGAGGGGAIIAIYARNIVINANGSITANGGNGGNGGNGSASAPSVSNVAVGGGGGAGGGAGGNGGQVIVVYNQLSGAGIANITATQGTKGTKGLGSAGSAGGSAGGDGADGSDGNPGAVRLFQLSL
jgi:hypothetical protein